MIVVTDTSPIRALAFLEQLAILEELFETVVIPNNVMTVSATHCGYDIVLDCTGCRCAIRVFCERLIDDSIKALRFAVWWVPINYQLRVPIGRCVVELELLATVCNLDKVTNRVEYLPLSRLSSTNAMQAASRPARRHQKRSTCCW